MADNYRLFSCSLDHLTDEEATWCAQLLETLAYKEGADSDWKMLADSDGKQLWMYGGGSGDTNHVLEFVQHFLRDFRPTGC